MKNCIHKPMPDYEDYYLISEEGDVWSNYTQKYLYLNDNGEGYLMFYACKKGKKTPKLVHKVVAETFIRRILPGEEANHKDRNRKNNSASNIQILTKKEHHHFHTGQNNGNTGRVMSQEQKNKIRATRQAKKKQNPDCYSFLKGKKRSQETIDKIKATREAKKAIDPDYYKPSAQTIEKGLKTRQKNGTLHRKHTEEELKRISQSNKGKHFQSQEQKAKTRATRQAKKAIDPDYYKRKK